MEKVNFVKNDVLRLPPGFRFHPTDEEIVVQYLRRKVHSSPLPVSIIPEVDVCKSDPWDLPGDMEHERFFFSTKEVKYRNGNRSNRATLSGFWKGTGLDKQIVSSSSKTNNNQEVVVGSGFMVFWMPTIGIIDFATALCGKAQQANGSTVLAGGQRAIACGDNYIEKLGRSGEKHVPVELALQIARDVSWVLSELHLKDIIHRDLKSENVLIDISEESDGATVVKLCDFDRAVPHIGIPPPDVCV
ncbi:NAC transcription factor 29 [Artemisia annua]|uniref:NAC transcription factor 29 n=1 Tax=Artemisia annua TaxID=35608 RepID=A0A2U1PHQ2_ARTAN|nr:NAC transcription factor 29 [Artemisia annua]